MNQLYVYRVTGNQAQGNQIDIPKPIAKSFFELSDDVLNNAGSVKLNVCHISNLKKYQEIEIQTATNPRFSTVLNTFLTENGDEMSEGDLLVVEKIMRSYSVRLIKENDAKYQPLVELFDEGERSMLLTAILDRATPLPLQRILYGAPGTGKSHKIDEQTNDDNSIRTTFHPDTDYATFVGAYKPMMDTVDEYALDATGETHKIDYPNGKSSIIYKYEPQVFLKAYVEAWKRYLNKQEGEDDSYYLVIEEINRGNCAQIFGDLFQLLDREDNGYSSYAISPESAITKYLAEDAQSADGTRFSDLKFSNVTKKRGDVEKIIATADDLKAGKRLVLPPNLYIWATMNTSDQSLFPMDSAFKRRWEWEYVPIKYNTSFVITVDNDHKYNWSDFQRVVNDEILRKTHSEDKQMGDYFIKKDVNLDEFINKVMFYLWNDVCKENYHTEDNFFRTKAENSEDEKEFSFVEMMQDKSSHIIDFMRKLGVENIAKKNDDNEATEEVASN